MKNIFKITVLTFFLSLFFSHITAQPFTNITAGQSGLSVRTNLNNTINYLNALGLQLQFSSDNTDWHYPWSVGDRYIRYSGNFGVSWSPGFSLYVDLVTDMNTGFIPRFDGNVFQNSTMYQDFNRIGIGTTTPTSELDIVGNLRIRTPGTAAGVNLLGITANGTVTTNISGGGSSDSVWAAITVTDTLNILGQNIQTISTGTSQNTSLTTKGYVDEAITAGGGYTDSNAQTAVGGILDNGTVGDIVFTYTPGTPLISGDVKDNSHLHTIANVTGLQDSLTAKQKTITGAATTIITSDLTASRALVSTSGGKIAVSDITATELSYLDNATSNIQTQLNALSGTWTKTADGLSYVRGTRKGEIGVGSNADKRYSIYTSRDSIGYAGYFYNEGSNAAAHGVYVYAAASNATPFAVAQSSLGDVFKVGSGGRLSMSRYTGTTMDGTLTKALGVDASGVVYTAAPGMSNPMSAAGDIIYGGASGAATRLAKGTDGQILTLVSGAPAWAAAGGGWTDRGTVIALADTTDRVVIGGPDLGGTEALYINTTKNHGVRAFTSDTYGEGVIGIASAFAGTGVFGSGHSYGLYANASGSTGRNYGGYFIANASTDGIGIYLKGAKAHMEIDLTISAPASASAAGTKGDVIITPDHIYVCTATNTWKRVAISTW
jgi:hypothetical protein